MRKLLLISLLASTAFAGSSQSLIKNAKAPVGAKRPPVAYPYWYPACLFIEEGVQTAQLDAISKQMVDGMASCGINLLLKPMMVTNVPKDSVTLQALAGDRCNAVTGAIKGVTHASAIVIPRDGKLIEQACKPGKQDIPSCVQYAQKPEPSLQSRMLSIGRMIETVPGRTSVSLVRPDHKTQSPLRQAQAMLGMSMSGLPSGDEYGSGVGNPFEGTATGGGGDSLGWHREACAHFQKGAFPNDGRYKNSPDQQYADNRMKPMDLAKDISLFGRPADAAAPKAQAAQNSGGGGGGLSTPPAQQTTELVDSAGDRRATGRMPTSRSKTVRTPSNARAKSGNAKLNENIFDVHSKGPQEAATPETAIPAE